jgi:hypothetical protein
MNNNNVRLRCEKKATLGGNQRRRVLRHETHPIWSPATETHPTSMFSSTKLSVTDFIACYQYSSDQ